MVSDLALTAVGFGAFFAVSIRFEVRGGFRREYCDNRKRNMKLVSIRFEVRGGFRPLIGILGGWWSRFNPL